MADHGLTIRRPPHIKLETVAAMLQAKLKRFQRVFGNVP
jgi:hypothetical protein